jgi:hypothetical protein
LVPASIEIILIPLSGDAAVVDGMYGAVMITGQTRGTLSTMQPSGRCTYYIIHRTDLRALATLDTDICIHRELLVGYHLLIEIAANHV